METKKKKSGLSSKGPSLREKMLARKKDLESRGNGNGLIYPKEGITRVRLKSPGGEQEFAIEVIQFYFNQELGGIISPATFGEPCPVMEKYQELKEGDDDDKELAKRLVPKRKYVLGGIFYKDEKGREVDTDRVDKGMMVGSGVYQDIIDLFLDEDEWGDMTDPINGYDIKISRTGKGKNDTSYTVSPCQRKPLDKKLKAPIDLEKIVRAQIMPYDKIKETLGKFLREDMDDDDEGDRRPKAKSNFKKKAKSGKKVGRTRDI